MNTPRLRLQEYRDKIAAGRGLLAREWDDFDSLERQLEPNAYRDRQAQGHHEILMLHARELSIEDLELILAEKRAEPTIAQTLVFIEEVHAGQFDLGGKPFWLHPVSVMNRLGPYATHHEKLAALLHDVLEDTPWTAEQLLERGYPTAVVDAVKLLTRPEGKGRPTYIDWIRLLARSRNRIAIRVKIADNEDNSDPERVARLPPEQRDIVKRYELSLKILRAADL